MVLAQAQIILILKDKNIFVTGGTGFLGSYLLRYLLREGYHNISALRRKDSPSHLVKDIQEKINWVEGDLLDMPLLEDALTGIDQVYHCAGFVSYHPKKQQQLITINEIGTANLVNALLYHGKGRLLHISSIAAIGKKKNDRNVSETNKWVKSPLNTPYATSKFLAEQQVWRGIAEGLNAVIINPSIILGSGFWDRGTARFFSRIYDGQKFFPLGGSGFVDVRDVAKMSIQLMESSLQAERFIANGTNLSYKNFFGLIARALNTTAPNQAAGKFLSSIAWRLEAIKCWLTGQAPFLTKETAKMASLSFLYDNSKSIQTLNYAYVPIEETVAATAQQFKASDYGKKVMTLPLI